MKTPLEISPYSLVQEFLRDQPWKLLVVVILLNKTSSVAALPVMLNILESWSTPEALCTAEIGDVVEILRPIGFYNRRASALIEMSKAFLRGFDDVKELPGIGKYGADSYNMFVKGEIVDDVEDKELKKYVSWAKTQNEA